MKVICLSAPRSGSTSLGQALKILGYTVFAGMGHNYFQDNCFELWDMAIRARYFGSRKPFTRKDFEKFLGPYDALCGWQAAILAEDLVAAYPNAKFVLVTRDSSQWAESFNETVIYTHRWWQKWNWILPISGRKERDFRRSADLWLSAWIPETTRNKDELQYFYSEHNERIREMVPSEQLLELEIEGSWEKLCEFLGTEVPNEPYPHRAIRYQFSDSMATIWTRALQGTIISVLILVIVGSIAIFIATQTRL